MIKYNLKCKNGHEFESWFSNSEEFEKLKKKDLLECIYCSSKNISKSIMAPMISSQNNKDEYLKIFNNDLKNKKNELLQLRKFIEKNFEYVGRDFSKKIRKAIYGTSTPEEKEELIDEGIDLMSIPWVDKDN